LVALLVGCGGEPSEALDESAGAYSGSPASPGVADARDLDALKGKTLQVATPIPIPGQATAIQLGGRTVLLSDLLRGEGLRRQCLLNVTRTTLEPRTLPKGAHYTFDLESYREYLGIERWVVTLHLINAGPSSPGPVGERSNYSIACSFYRPPTGYVPSYEDVVAGLAPELKIVTPDANRN